MINSADVIEEKLKDPELRAAIISTVKDSVAIKMILDLGAKLDLLIDLVCNYQEETDVIKN